MTTHNVRVDAIEATTEKARTDPAAAALEVKLQGEWRVDEADRQFGGKVVFPKGETVFEADFPPFLGGEGRAPTPLAYCFYGAMCCYGATFATQAAMAGMSIKAMSIRLHLTVDFRTALGLGDFPPMDQFRFEVDVETDADEATVERVKTLAEERCPAIWAMRNPVPYSITTTKSG